MNIAIILSGGTGSRTGSEIPKQYIEACGRPMIAFSMETFLKHEGVDAVQIVADEMWREFILRHAAGRFPGFSTPGASRQLSVWNALSDIREYAADGDTVMIHDAARPFVTSALISGCLKAMEGHDGVMPVLPMKDTVYMGNGKRICSLLERERVYAGQAPEMFLFGKYYEANRALLPDRILSVNGSTEPAVLAGMDIAMTEGDEDNFKVTTAGDVDRFRRRAELLCCPQPENIL